MFVGELCCLFAYFIMKLFSSKKEKEDVHAEDAIPLSPGAQMAEKT